MIRLPQAIVAVMTCTLSSGAAGGIVGAAVGRFAPSFVRWLHSPGRAAPVDPTEFGFGLGVVCGLLMGGDGVVSGLRPDPSRRLARAPWAPVEPAGV